MIRSILALGLAALTTACVTATPPPPPPVLEYTRQDCEAQPNLSSAVSLTPEKETNGFIVSAELGLGSPCIRVANWTAPYAVFALPTDMEDKTIAVGGVLELTRILSPDVRILDSQGQVTREFSTTDYFYRGPVYSVQFRPRPGDAYVVVSSDPARVGQRYDSINVGTNTTTVYTGYGAANVTTGVEAHNSRAFSYEGLAQVIVYDSDTKERPIP